MAVTPRTVTCVAPQVSPVPATGEGRDHAPVRQARPTLPAPSRLRAVPRPTGVTTRVVSDALPLPATTPLVVVVGRDEDVVATATVPAVLFPGTPRGLTKTVLAGLALVGTRPRRVEARPVQGLHEGQVPVEVTSTADPIAVETLADLVATGQTSLARPARPAEGPLVATPSDRHAGLVPAIAPATAAPRPEARGLRPGQEGRQVGPPTPDIQGTAEVVPGIEGGKAGQTILKVGARPAMADAARATIPKGMVALARTGGILVILVDEVGDAAILRVVAGLASTLQATKERPTTKANEVAVPTVVNEATIRLLLVREATAGAWEAIPRRADGTRTYPVAKGTVDPRADQEVVRAAKAVRPSMATRHQGRPEAKALTTEAVPAPSPVEAGPAIAMVLADLEARRPEAVDRTLATKAETRLAFPLAPTVEATRHSEAAARQTFATTLDPSSTRPNVARQANAEILEVGRHARDEATIPALVRTLLVAVHLTVAVANIHARPDDAPRPAHGLAAGLVATPTEVEEVVAPLALKTA